MPEAGLAARSWLTAGSVYAFVVLGLPAGMLGVAWPVLRRDFGEPLAALGELVVASVAGYLLVSALTGRTLRRFGTAVMLTASAVAAAAATAVFVTTHGWPALVAASAVGGAAGGGLDAGLNTAVALTGESRVMNLIHAAFGVGAALGPLAVTAAVAVTSSWRPAYVLLLVLQIALAGVWIAVRGQFGAIPDHRPTVSPASYRHLAPVLGLSIAVFFVYAGMEIGIGAWAASYLRGPGGLTAGLAGAAVFGYWAGLTASRAGAAALGHRLSARNAAYLGTAVALVGAIGMWAEPGQLAQVIALAVVGAGLGPVFPALVTLTPGRVGEVASVSVVGWELAAAGVGGAAISALAGLIFQDVGLEAFRTVVMVLAVGVCGLNLLVEQAARGFPVSS